MQVTKNPPCLIPSNPPISHRLLYRRCANISTDKNSRDTPGLDAFGCDLARSRAQCPRRRPAVAVQQNAAMVQQPPVAHILRAAGNLFPVDRHIVPAGALRLHAELPQCGRLAAWRASRSVKLLNKNGKRGAPRLSCAPIHCKIRRRLSFWPAAPVTWIQTSAI